MTQPCPSVGRNRSGAIAAAGNRGDTRTRRRQAPAAAPRHQAEADPLSNDNILTLAEIENRIAIARDNIRQLIEQAAAFSGANDEERNADRIAEQQDELDRMIQQRDELRGKA